MKLVGAECLAGKEVLEGCGRGLPVETDERPNEQAEAAGRLLRRAVEVLLVGDPGLKQQALELAQVARRELAVASQLLDGDVILVRKQVDARLGPGLVAALGACARLKAGLLVPFPVNLPGEQSWRLVAGWLHRRGLNLYLGGGTFCWRHARDEVDFAIRRTLDAAHDLDAPSSLTAA